MFPVLDGRPELTAGPCAIACNAEYGATAIYSIDLYDYQHCHCGNAVGNMLRSFSSDEPMFSLIKGSCKDASVTSEWMNLSITSSINDLTKVWVTSQFEQTLLRCDRNLSWLHS